MSTQFARFNELLEKPLPNAIESEKTALGTVLLDSRAFESIAVKDAEMFYSPMCKTIFQAMKNVWLDQKPLDVVTIAEELKEMGKLDDIGGASVLLSITKGVPAFSSVDRYFAIIEDAYNRRKLINEAQHFINRLLDYDSIEHSFLTLSDNVEIATKSSTVGEPSLLQLKDAIPHQIAKWDEYLNPDIQTCISTGLPDIDSQLTGGGFAKGLFHVIAGFPGMGKSSLALDIAGHTLLNGKSVVYFTIELSKEIFLNRLCSPFAGVPRFQIASNQLTEFYAEKLKTVLRSFSSMPLWIDSKSNTMPLMNQSLRKVARQTGGEIDLIIVDYVQRMTGDGYNEHQVIKSIVNQQAQWAKEYNAAVLTLSQFKRVGDDKRTGQRPQMSWLKESGSLEEAARTILGIWQSQPQFEDFARMKLSGERGVKPVTISCIKQGEGAEFDFETCFLTDCLTFGSRNEL